MTDKTLQDRLRFELSRIADEECYDGGSHQLMFLRQSEARELRDALDAQDERIKALEGALRGGVSDWDARGNGLEVFKDDPECPYWSPSAAMVGSEHINRARALLGEK